MRNCVFLLLLFALVLLTPNTAEAKVCKGETIPDDAICLNLSYPAFGGFDLNDDQQLPQIIAFFYYFLVAISGLAAFVMLVVGGIQWLVSGAIPSQASAARDKIRNAILGLLLILASFLIIQVINPELTIITTPGLCPPTVTCQGNIPKVSLPTFLSAGAYFCLAEECQCVRSDGHCIFGNDLNSLSPDGGLPDLLILDPGQYDDLFLWNDKPRALNITGPGNFAIVLTKDKNFAGEAICFEISIDKLDDFGWDIKAGSVVVLPDKNMCSDFNSTKAGILDVFPSF